MPLKFTNEQLSGSFLMLGPGQRAVVKGTIKDDETGEEHEAAVVFGPLGIEIKLDGYGERCSPDGHGSPVYVEFHEGTLFCRVWSDINVEDAVGINLEAAREDRRFEVGDRVRTTAVGRPHLIGEIAETCPVGNNMKFRVVETSAHYDGHERWYAAEDLEHDR